MVGQNRRLCSRLHSHESVIFFRILAFLVFTLRPLCLIHAADGCCGGRIGLCISPRGSRSNAIAYDHRHTGVYFED